MSILLGQRVERKDQILKPPYITTGHTHQLYPIPGAIKTGFHMNPQMTEKGCEKV